jgi:hypothetical protein
MSKTKPEKYGKNLDVTSGGRRLSTASAIVGGDAPAYSKASSRAPDAPSVGFRVRYA